MFEDLDPRMLRPTGPRRLRVVRIEVTDAWLGRILVEDIVTGLQTHIRWDRLLKGGRRGYRKVSEEEPHGV